MGAIADEYIARMQGFDRGPFTRAAYEQARARLNRPKPTKASNDFLVSLVNFRNAAKLGDWERWCWVASSGTEFYLNRMSLNHIVSAARMIWNCWLVKHVEGLKHVVLGRGWDLEHRHPYGLYKAMCMFIWYTINHKMDEIGKDTGGLHEIFTDLMMKAHDSDLFPAWVFERETDRGHSRTEIWMEAVDKQGYESIGNVYDSLVVGRQELVNETIDSVVKSHLAKLDPTTWRGYEDHEGCDSHDSVGTAKIISSADAEQEIPKEFFMSKKIQCVLVSFGDQRDYKYFSVVEDLKVEDLVVVEAHDAYGLARVVAVDVPKEKATKWVVQKVDTSVVDAMKADIRKAREIKKLLNAKLELQRERIVYETLAEKDPEAKELLDQLAALEG